MSKPVILTGLRANQDLQLGNYLGALLPLVKLQRKYAGEYQVNIFVPDLHSFTTPVDHQKLYQQTLNNIKIYAAAGLDIDQPDTFIYRQSFIPAHSELTWILDCFTYMGELRRMTQFKEKSEGQDTVSVGLFNYPVLMAADILLYGARYVPVGEDQQQHVELTRDIALRVNEKFKDVFPDGIFQPPLERQKQLAFLDEKEALRIRDLQRPENKMSKSDASGKGVIFLSDTPDAAAKKVMSAATDSLAEIRYDMKQRPGISNLLQIQTLLTDRSLEDVIKQYEGQTQYGPLKQAVATSVHSFLSGFQAKLAEVDEQRVKAKLQQSEAAMNKVAGDALLRVQQAAGLRPL
jgi:tryptophanyl-tRNA synthetase